MAGDFSSARRSSSVWVASEMATPIATSAAAARSFATASMPERTMVSAVVAVLTTCVGRMSPQITR